MIHIPDNVLEDMKIEGIDRAMVENTLLGAEESFEKVFDEEKGLYFCHRRTGSVTLWVSYRKDEELLTVNSIYTHRMDIEEDI